MGMSVRLDATLEARVDQEAKRLGVTRSAFVKDTLERALGINNPSLLLDEICSDLPMGDPDASQNVSDKFKAKLRAKHSY